MSANKYYFLSGKVKWFRPDKANQWGKWEHVLYPDAKSLEIINELKAGNEKVGGIKNRLQKDDDGYYIRIGRPASKEIKGKIVGFSPPTVVSATGDPLRNVLVGNGSDITTKVEVYQHRVPTGGYARAMRWESTRIDNLVPFERTKDLIAEEKEKLEGMDETPKQEATYW